MVILSGTSMLRQIIGCPPRSMMDTFSPTPIRFKNSRMRLLRERAEKGREVHKTLVYAGNADQPCLY